MKICSAYYQLPVHMLQPTLCNFRAHVDKKKKIIYWDIEQKLKFEFKLVGDGFAKLELHYQTTDFRSYVFLSFFDQNIAKTDHLSFNCHVFVT